MRAVRFERGGKIDVVNVPNPKPGPEEVLVQVLAAGVCHTDLHLLDGMSAPDSEPLIPGHEIVGRIAKVGGDVYSAAVGDRVVVHFEQPCGECRQCRRMRTNLCERGHTLGFDSPGGYAEFVVAKQNTVLPLPPNLDPAVAAPLGCSGATAYRAIVTQGQAGENDLVVVISAGGVGLSAVQVAKVQEAKVLAVDTREEARKAALDVRADRATTPKDTSNAVRELRFVAVAPGEERTTVSANDLVDGGKSYLGVYSSTMADLARAVALAEAGRLTPVVTRRAPLAAAAEVLDDLRAGRIVGRAVLFPGSMDGS